MMLQIFINRKLMNEIYVSKHEFNNKHGLSWEENAKWKIKKLEAYKLFLKSIYFRQIRQADNWEIALLTGGRKSGNETYIDAILESQLRHKG